MVALADERRAFLFRQIMEKLLSVPEHYGAGGRFEAQTTPEGDRYFDFEIAVKHIRSGAIMRE